MEYKFTDAEFAAEVLQSDIPVLVDFYAEWCGPCKMMAPVIKELADKYAGKVKIGKLNVDENPNITQQYKIMSVPTFLLFVNGEKKADIAGAVSQKALEELLQQG